MCAVGLQGKADLFGQGLTCKQQEFLCEKGATVHCVVSALGER